MTAQREFGTVVFDLDGVLIDSFAVMRQAFAVAYREVVGEGEPPFEEYRTHQGRYFPDIMRLMGLPPQMEQPFVEASHRLVAEVEVYPDVPLMLKRLRECDIRTGIATGKSGVRARTVLEAVGLLPLLRRLGAGPEDAVMVGDAVIDIQSGRAAGTATAAALWGETAPDPLRAQRPDFVLERPADLLALVPCEAAR
jgi:AHBA synthesis associated protein